MYVLWGGMAPASPLLCHCRADDDDHCSGGWSMPASFNMGPMIIPRPPTPGQWSGDSFMAFGRPRNAGVCVVCG